MEIVTCYQTNNRCYKRGTKATHVGILVHSTGATNTSLKRYVDYEERLGKNQYSNHWNNDKADKCMHAFIGKDKDGKVIVAETLPYEFACWGCGKGSKGSYNYNPVAHIQFEICQGSDTDQEYYAEAIHVAESYCAYLCSKFGLTIDNICSHREAAKAGYASNHGDPENWMKYFNDDMNKFRDRVREKISGSPVVLRKGDKGQAVKALQERLLDLGYSLPKFGADASFGDETLQAVKKFQADHGLTADGIVGEATHAALNGTSVASKTYSITIRGLSEAAANALHARHTNSSILEEKGR